MRTLIFAFDYKKRAPNCSRQCRFLPGKLRLSFQLLNNRIVLMKGIINKLRSSFSLSKHTVLTYGEAHKAPYTIHLLINFVKYPNDFIDLHLSLRSNKEQRNDKRSENKAINGKDKKALFSQIIQ